MHEARMAESDLADLQQVLGHRFRRPELLERALTHSSALGERARAAERDNERLEYLGDAVLGLLVSEYLIDTFPDWTEGQLSKGRARLVNSASLYEAARRLDLGPHLRLSRGEEKTGGREKPALLANTFEALVAAIYVDGGLDAARQFVARSLLDAAVAAEGARLEQSDHKSALQELLQAHALPAARYNVVREEGPDHRKTFWVEVSVNGLAGATGSGANKKEAEQSAAEQALRQLREEVEKD
jgi:ribonuclease-3